MGKSTIEWTERTWNPLRGCTKISPGCKHCYAETFAERWRGIPGHPYEQGFDLRLVPEKLDEPLRRRKPTTYFVNSMSDLFQDGVPFEYIAAVFGVMAAAPAHTFQVLTKRAERMAEWFRWAEKRGEDGARLFDEDPLDWRIRQLCHVEARRKDVDLNADKHQNHGGPWPLANVWLGVSVENQKYGDERIQHLLACPAAVRFVSYEPALGPVDFSQWLRPHDDSACPVSDPGCLGGEGDRHDACERPAGIHQVIIGAESGAGARPFEEAWARSVRDQCAVAGVAFFYKQRVEKGRKISLPVLDGQQHAAMPEGR